jgi:hypothetical protein
MTQGKRTGFSAAQKTEVWSRWKAGQSLHRIGRAFGKPHTSIHCLLSHHGGIAPAARRRSLLALTLAQSELDKIATRLNQRPRKTLGFQTPPSRLRASVAPTH